LKLLSNKDNLNFKLMEEQLNGLKMEKIKSVISKLGRYVIFGIIITLGMISFSCSGDGADEGDVVVDEYYVEYIFDSSTIYSGGQINVTMKGENNQSITRSVKYRERLELIIGPVSKGFNARISATAITDTYSHLYPKAEIGVSKNNGPFATKVIDESNSPRESLSINYTIDY
jgi:hypothetical protein